MTRSGRFSTLSDPYARLLIYRVLPLPLPEVPDQVNLKTKSNKSFMSKPKSAKVEIEAGLYYMVPRTIADIGTQTVSVFGKPDEEEEKKQCILVVELPELSKPGKPFTLSKWITNSSSDKAWGGKLMKAQGLNNKTADWNDILGKPFQAEVSHTEGGNAKIGDPISIKKGTNVPKGSIKEHLSIFLDDSYSKEAFEAMPEFIQNAIIKAPEFDGLDSKKGKKPSVSKGSAKATTKRGK